MGGVNLPPMNKPQKQIVLAGLIIIALMLLFPPWRNQSQYFKGLSFIFYPRDWQDSIDLALLAIEVLFVVIVLAAAYLYLLWKEDFWKEDL